MKSTALLASLALAVGVLAGCGGGAGGGRSAAERFVAPRQLQVTLDGYASAANVAILMAEKRGFFADQGLEVSAARPLAPQRSVPYVADGTDDLGLAQEPQVAIARGKGAPVVAIGSVIAQPTAAMIWLKRSHVRSLSDLKGKTIATTGVPFQEEALRALLARAGLSLNEVHVRGIGYDLVSALLKGRVDAIFGGSGNIEGVELEERGAEPVVKPVQSLGVPPYDELVVVARSDLVAEDPRAAHAFMAAVVRGAAAAIEDPEEAVEMIEESPWRGPKASRRATRAQVRATLPLLSRDGRLSLARARRLVAWMSEEGMVPSGLSPASLLAAGASG